MKRIARGRWFLVGSALVVTLALAGCNAEPTPTPTPTATPTPTPTVLENIRATIEGARATIQEGRIGDLADTVTPQGMEEENSELTEMGNPGQRSNQRPSTKTGGTRGA